MVNAYWIQLSCREHMQDDSCPDDTGQVLQYFACSKTEVTVAAYSDLWILGAISYITPSLDAIDRLIQSCL